MSIVLHFRQYYFIIHSFIDSIERASQLPTISTNYLNDFLQWKIKLFRILLAITRHRYDWHYVCIVKYISDWCM